MYVMAEMMDYMISPLPIRIVDNKVESSKLKIPSLRVLQVGYLPGRTLRRTKVSFDHWAFVFITGGEGTVQVENEEIQKVESGCMFFVYPGVSLSYGPMDYWDEYYIRFEGERIKDWLNSKMIKHQFHLKNVEVNPKWINKIESIYLKIDSGLPADADRAALLLENLIFECHQWDNKTSTKQSTLFLSILKDLAKNIDVSMNAKDVAERHHISVSTLRRVVKRNTGYPLHEYWHRLKVEEAKRYLITTNSTFAAQIR
jgi:AraC family transcriptional regulator of arabinose operon